MTNEFSFLPEGTSMDQFIADSSYEELMAAYNVAIVEAGTPDSPEVLAILQSAVNQIAPTITENLQDAGVLMYDESWVAERLLSEHYYYSGAGGAGGAGVTPLEELMQMAYYADDEGVTEGMLESFDTSISTAHEIRPDVVAERVELEARAEEIGNGFSRLGEGLASAYSTFDYYGNQALAGAYNIFVSEENEITGEELGAAYDEWSRGADAALYEAGEFTVETVALSFSSDPEDRAESDRRVRDLGITIGDGIVDAGAGVVGLAAGGGAYIINRAPEVLGYEPTFGEDYTAWNAFDAVNGADDAALGYIYDQFGYELRTDGAYGTFHLAAEIIGTGGAGGVVIKGGTNALRLTRGLDTTLDATRSADVLADATRVGPTRAAAEALELAADELPAAAFRAPTGFVDEAAVTIRPITGAADEAAARVGPTRAAAEALETAEEVTPNAALRTAGAADEVAEATRPNIATRAFNFMAPNSPRGLYNSSASASERLSLLASRGDEGLPFMNRIIMDIRAGRTPIESSAIDGLRANGRIPQSVMGQLDEIQPLLRANGTLPGSLGFRISNMGNTLHNMLPTIPTASLRGAASVLNTATFGPARLAIGSLRSFRGAFTASAAYLGDEFATGGAIREFYGDVYGAMVRGAGSVAEWATGSGGVGTAFDVAAAIPDADTTIAGELREDGNGVVAAVVERVPGLGDGEHIPVNGERTPEGPASERDGEGSLTELFNGMDFSNMGAKDYTQIGIGLLAGLNAFQGNYVGAAMFGAIAYYLDDILEIADNFLESQGIDIIPDHVYESRDNTAPVPAMG